LPEFGERNYTNTDNEGATTTVGCKRLTVEAHGSSIKRMKR